MLDKESAIHKYIDAHNSKAFAVAQMFIKSYKDVIAGDKTLKLSKAEIAEFGAVFVTLLYSDAKIGGTTIHFNDVDVDIRVNHKEEEAKH